MLLARAEEVAEETSVDGKNCLRRKGCEDRTTDLFSWVVVLETADLCDSSLKILMIGAADQESDRSPDLLPA